MVGGAGAIGTGDFALHLMATYRGAGPAALCRRRYDAVAGPIVLKFTRRCPWRLSNYVVYAPPVKSVVGYEVTVWHDAQSLELLASNAATSFQQPCRSRKTFKTIEYQDALVGGSEVPDARGDWN